MNYDEALAFLKAASGRGSIMGLERIAELMKKLGSVQEKVPVIHISGTNGKGSFGAMMSSVLHSAGYTVGSFSSPAITDVTDQFRINCEPVGKDDFAALIDDVSKACSEMSDLPTEFEILTAAAYLMFDKFRCDVALVECGMGGDTDSTNVISSPLLSVITNIQSDHCRILGDSLEEIAAHKAGIIKPGCPVYYGGCDDVYRIIRRKADESESEVFLPVMAYMSEPEYTLSGTKFTYKGYELTLPLLGTYQTENVLNVLSCVDILRSKGVYIPYTAVREGLSKAKWHGRFEVLCRSPYVIYDGSHNPDGIKRAAESIRMYFKGQKTALLIGIMADKDYSAYPETMADIAEKVFTVKPDNPRSMDPEKLAEIFTGKGIPAESFEQLPDGVAAAYSYAKSKNIPLIMLGSLYMYHEAAAALQALC